VAGCCECGDELPGSGAMELESQLATLEGKMFSCIWITQRTQNVSNKCIPSVSFLLRILEAGQALRSKSYSELIRIQIKTAPMSFNINYENRISYAFAS
jgi:hypothetical protein